MAFVSIGKVTADLLERIRIRACQGIVCSTRCIIRRALGIMQAVDEARQFGRYVGTTKDRESLETVIVTPI